MKLLYYFPHSYLAPNMCKAKCPCTNQAAFSYLKKKKMLLKKEGRNKLEGFFCLFVSCSLEPLSEDCGWARQVFPTSRITCGLNFNGELRFG